MKKLLLVFIFLIGALGVLWLPRAEKKIVLRPIEIGADNRKTITLKSIRVINPRFPRLSEGQLATMLQELKIQIGHHLGIQPNFVFDPDININAFFGIFSHDTEARRNFINRFIEDSESRMVTNQEELVKGLKSVHFTDTEHFTFDNLLSFLKTSRKPLKSSRDLEIKSLDQLFKVVAKIHIEKFNEIHSITLEDGKGIIEENDFNEFPLWEGFLKNYTGHHLIITNQPIISSSEPFPAIHSSLRGGISLGFATRAAMEYGSIIVFSTFPFIFDHPVFNEMRDFEVSSGMIPQYIGNYLVHEFGHAYAYWGHYYQPGCIMNPARGLRFKAWYEETKNKKNCNAMYREDYRDYFLAPFYKN